MYLWNGSDEGFVTRFQADSGVSVCGQTGSKEQRSQRRQTLAPNAAGDWYSGVRIVFYGDMNRVTARMAG
jgi:hypothetical protein